MHEVQHLLVGIAGGHPLADYTAQILGEIGVRLLDRLGLADWAAQLAADRLGAGFELGVLQHLIRVDCEGAAGGEAERQQNDRPAPHFAPSLASSGRIVSRMSAWVSGSALLKRIRPSASTMKVSGAP